MVFSSTVFLFLFLPSLLILYYLPFVKSRLWKNAVLLIFSLGFYAWGEPAFSAIMVFSIIINWAFGLRIQKSANKRKVWLSAGILYDVLLIGIFKYASFLSSNIAKLTGNDRIILQIALPIGISFFTFQLMSYLFDIYYGKSNAQKNPLHVALYISLFPQLIAGPIVRYQQIADEITDRSESFSSVANGMRRFVYGLGKKVLIANFVAQIADNVFDYLDSPSVVMAWLGAIAYTLQIYYDFSGYSDMAIGLGMMFGFHFSENFNYPYIAKSVTDFWRRWHISLSTWFRDYVYIPLGGNRVSKHRWVLNMFIVWLLTGIWHGANWTFIMWGLFYFLILLFEKAAGFTRTNSFFSHVYTLLIVIIGWVIFRSPDISSGFQYLGHMFGIRANGFFDKGVLTYLKATYIVLIISLIGVSPFVAKLFNKLRERGKAWVESLWLLVIFLASLIQVVAATYNPFIYFNF